MKVFKQESVYSREGRAIEGAVPILRGDDFDIVFTSLEAPAWKIQEIRDEVFHALSLVEITQETMADRLNKQIETIVSGGFLDPLDDASVQTMARKIDRSISIRYYKNAAPAGNEYQFEIKFSDGSSVSFDACDLEG